ncbi:anti-sigma-K factor RskA [Methylorubrum pseudosasae]|nr:anti-sigma-K factor RskA [Methylorubrum pseudosasae]
MSGGSGRPEPAERDLRAAEYVLGTLDAGERAAFELERAVDPATEAAVRAWERRLAPLARAVPAIEPPAHIWQEIAREIAQERERGTAADDPAPRPDQAGAANDNRLRDLRRQLRLWRFTAAGARGWLPPASRWSCSPVRRGPAGSERAARGRAATSPWSRARATCRP